MTRNRFLEYGGILAGIVLIVFGIVAIGMGANGRNTVRDSLKQEQIFFGDVSDPAVAAHAKNWAGDQVLTGSQARAFALIMHDHATEATGGLTYAEMGRYTAVADPTSAKGTNDAAAAVKDVKGNPIDNGARNVWVTETGLSTALNMSYMAENLALFGMVVGVALLLSGIGFIILALRVLGGVPATRTEKDPAPSMQPAGQM